MKLTLIIPCYNEEETIDLIYKEIINVLGEYKELEILFVNDGSKDSTLQKIIDLSSKDERVGILYKIIQIKKQVGLL